jgi:hypothetical protein
MDLDSIWFFHFWFWILLFQRKSRQQYKDGDCFGQPVTYSINRKKASIFSRKKAISQCEMGLNFLVYSTLFRQRLTSRGQILNPGSSIK